MASLETIWGRPNCERLMGQCAAAIIRPSPMGRNQSQKEIVTDFDRLWFSSGILGGESKNVSYGT